MRRKMAPKPHSGNAPNHDDDLAAIRMMAMKLVGELDRFAEAKNDNHDSVLLRKGDGVIDGLNKLSQILTRVIGKARRDPEDAEGDPVTPLVDERELERRIIAEIDRRSAARGADRGLPAGRP